MDQHQSRYIVHNYDNQLQKQVLSQADTEKLKEQMKTQIFTQLLQNVVEFQQTVKPGDLHDHCSNQQKQRVDLSMFSGSGGYLLLYIRLYEFFLRLQARETNQFNEAAHKVNKSLYSAKTLSDEQAFAIFDPQIWLDKANQQFVALEQHLNQGADKMISFYMSGAAIWLYGCKLYYYMQDPHRFKLLYTKIMEYYQKIIARQQDLYYEILYGLPGYIYILLELQKFHQQIPEQLKNDYLVDVSKEVCQLCQILLAKGLESYGKQFNLPFLMQQDNVQFPKDFRLTYTFHQKEYLGGAHGLLGVIQIFLLSYQQNKQLFDNNKELSRIMLQCINQSLNSVLGLQLQSGNFPTSYTRNQSDILQQFCHGAPGAVAPLVYGHQFFKDVKFLEAAKRASDSIWKFGFIKKAFGICHGIPGNAYAFLRLFQYTKEFIYYQQAWKFLLYKQDQVALNVIKAYDFGDRYNVGVSDNPFSLMLGIVGDIVCQIDFIDEGGNGFPGFEL